MDKPLVDIAMATFNGEKFLDEQLRSIFNQSNKDFRLIIRDDGSSDHTKDIIRDYQKQYPNRLEFIPSLLPAAGAMGNFSLIVEKSSADYIMFCDQDDIWIPDKISISLQAIREIENTYSTQTPILVHTDLMIINPGNQLIHPSFFRYTRLNPRRTSLNHLFFQNVVTGNTMIINRSLANSAFPIPDGALMHDWWLALVASSLGNIGYIDQPTVQYRQHSKNFVGARRYDKNLILEKFLQSSHQKSKKIIQGYFKQAQVLESLYGNNLSRENSKILCAFISLQDSSFFCKRLKMLRFGFSKGSLLQTIGLYISI